MVIARSWQLPTAFATVPDERAGRPVTAS